MKCKQVSEQIPGYLAGFLDSGDMLRIQSHAAHCASCQTELDQLGQAWSNLSALPDEEPSPASSQRFYTMLEAYRHGLDEPKTAPHKKPSRWRPRSMGASLWGLAWSLAILAFGFWLGGNGARLERDETSALKQNLNDMTQRVSLSMMRQNLPGDRLTGVRWTAEIDRPSPEILETLLQILDHDPNPNVRLSAVDALYHYRGQEPVRKGLVRSLTRQNSPLVQIALIDTLIALDQKDASTELESLLGVDGLDPTVRMKAQQGLMRMR